ncbi:MAG: pilus assembly protein TadG-related protein [Actinomycetota bacterium]
MTSERGQAVPWLLLIVLVAMGLVAFAARLGPTVDDAAQARTAADAAALAGAVEGRAGAADLAAANGGSLVAFHRRPGGVEVVVQVGDVRARAEAVAVSSWQHVGETD